MMCNGFKGGIGTSSRLVTVAGKHTCWACWCRCNYGGDLHVLGAPVGREITDLKACATLPQTRPWIAARMPQCAAASRRDAAEEASELGRGSIVVVVATDAPLLPHQLKRIARRVGMGLGKLGSWAGNGSGDLFLLSRRPIQEQMGRLKWPNLR
jgi:L-aminopeptidase/D-esterase-like protein